MVEVEFAHSWPQDGHMFRVECSIGVTTDNVFILSIDGVKFQDLQFKTGLPPGCLAHKAGPTSSAGGTVKGFGSSSSSSNHSSSTSHHTPNSSEGSTSYSTAPQRRSSATHADPPVSASKYSNASNNKSSFDPFQNSSQGTSNAFSNSDPFASSVSTNTFDPFESAPVAPNVRTAPATVFDPFAVQSTNDLFATPAAPVARVNQNNNNGIVDLFNSPIPSTTTPAAITASPSVFDPFATPSSLPPVKANPTSDFANLSYLPSTTTSVAALHNNNNVNISTSTAVPEKPDLYKGLVNLDLGGSGSGAAAKRNSITTVDPNKSLNSIMGSGGMGYTNPSSGMGAHVSMSGNPTYGGAPNPFMNTGNIAGNRTSMNMSSAYVHSTNISGVSNTNTNNQQKNSLDTLNWKA